MGVGPGMAGGGILQRTGELPMPSTTRTLLLLAFMAFSLAVSTRDTTPPPCGPCLSNPTGVASSNSFREGHFRAGTQANAPATHAGVLHGTGLISTCAVPAATGSINAQCTNSRYFIGPEMTCVGSSTSGNILPEIGTANGGSFHPVTYCIAA
jgi:hypothetical protein